jgi:hypothetical protein
LAAVFMLRIASHVDRSYGEQNTCEARLRQSQSTLEIVRAGRDQLEAQLAEIFNKYQDVARQLESLKSQKSE